jgi:serine/threonine-protein kinase HipA
MGGIRFKENEEENFLNDNSAMASPPWTSLKELEFASLQLEREDAVNDPDYLKWLNMLLAPGSSLGGARPKASVSDERQQLWIAKFPSNHDDHDIGGWEMVANELALLSGVNVAEGMVKKLSRKYNSFLSKRFDRARNGVRIHFASAMTLLGLNDGNDHSEGISYLHIAEFIMQNGANPNKDLAELWRRIVFSICISNTDDHLRNHGFLLTDKGWVLSPAYDINPVKGNTGLKLNISLNDNALELDLALEVAGEFRMNLKEAELIIAKIKKATSDWRKIAAKYKISKTEQDLMETAFYLSR